MHFAEVSLLGVVDDAVGRGALESPGVEGAVDRADLLGPEALFLAEVAEPAHLGGCDLVVRDHLEERLRVRRRLRRRRSRGSGLAGAAAGEVVGEAVERWEVPALQVARRRPVVAQGAEGRGRRSLADVAAKGDHHAGDGDAVGDGAVRGGEVDAEAAAEVGEAKAGVGEAEEARQRHRADVRDGEGDAQAAQLEAEEAEVEARVVTDDDRAADGVEEVTGDVLERRRTVDVGVEDPVDLGGADRSSRVDQRLEEELSGLGTKRHAIDRELDDAIGAGREARRLGVDGHHRRLRQVPVEDRHVFLGAQLNSRMNSRIAPQAVKRAITGVGTAPVLSYTVSNPGRRRIGVLDSETHMRLRPARPGALYRLAVLALLAIFGCDSSDGPTTPATEGLFVVRTCHGSEHAPEGELFRVLIRDPQVVAEAESRIGAGTGRILTGPVVAGDGGFNAPWSWHLDPDDVGFTDAAIEVCDGCPSFIEDDLDTWLDTVGHYCPWGTEIVSRER